MKSEERSEEMNYLAEAFWIEERGQGNVQEKNMAVVKQDTTKEQSSVLFERSDRISSIISLPVQGEAA